METHWITAALSGNHVTIRQNSVTNSGTLTGIAALTLAARMASPQPALMNNGGSLLTSGDLTITAGSITSSTLAGQTGADHRRQSGKQRGDPGG